MKLKTGEFQKGQSLIELLIGITVGAILIISAAALISVTLRISAQNKFLQAASFLSQDLLDKVSVYAERQWYCPTVCTGGNYGLYNLVKGEGNPYYLNIISAQTFQWESGTESITADNVQYSRYFYVEDVQRDSSGAIASGSEDPSTQRITAVTSWPEGGEVRIVKYVTRNRNEVFRQTDWSGGGGQSSLWANKNEFDDSSNIDYTSIPGSIHLLSP